MPHTKIDLQHPYALFITGPTATGKTDLARMLAQQLKTEVINADIGQCYTPLSIGTAKPDWRNEPVRHHLFDCINEPKNFSAAAYGTAVNAIMHELWQAHRMPILVGGSMFYLKSLLFPMNQEDLLTLQQPQTTNTDRAETVTWEQLCKVDPVRAAEVHPHDRYRISRALQFWHATGQPISAYKPTFNPGFNAIVIYIDQKTDILHERITTRTTHMLNKGWIKEVGNLMQQPIWRTFIKRKGFIGYEEIAQYIENPHQCSERELAQMIATKTAQYAKKQRTFWKSFRAALTKYENSAPFHCAVHEIHGDATQALQAVTKHLPSEGRG